MVDFGGLGSVEAEVGLKLVFASMSHGCIYGDPRSFRMTKKHLCGGEGTLPRRHAPKGMQAPYWSVRYEVSMTRGTGALCRL
jgi:hypothetical protein